MEATRCWKAFFEPLQIQCHGHTGPTGAHAFKMVQRSDLMEEGSDGLVVDRGALGEHIPEHAEDIIMLVKEFMHSRTVCQQPLLFLPYELAKGLPEGGPASSTPVTRLPDDKAKEYMKTAGKVRAMPWQLEEAAEYLEQWVQKNVTGGTRPLPLAVVFNSWTQQHRHGLAINWPAFAPSKVSAMSVGQLPKRRRVICKKPAAGPQAGI